jgi:putative two-component system response regulator
MELHSIIGGNILKGSDARLLKQARLVALTHHERYDGKGYPRRLKGEKIPIEGRITILADIFDALSSRRVYKEALPENEVLRILEEGRGVFFDPEILPLFLDRLEEAREIQSRYGDRPEDFDKFRNLDQVAIEDD